MKGMYARVSTKGNKSPNQADASASSEDAGDGGSSDAVLGSCEGRSKHGRRYWTLSGP